MTLAGETQNKQWANPPLNTGVFISLDGVDGAGKSTQCTLLADWLRAQGNNVVTVTDPGGTAAGDRIRDMVLHGRQELAVHCEALLFMASRAQLVAEIIAPALAAGKAVVADRYLLANVVYQGHAGGIDPTRLLELGLFACNGVEPNLTIVLDLSVECAHARKHLPADRMESRDAAFHARVRAGFLAEASRRPDRVHIIDGSQPTDSVHAKVIAEVSHVLAARARA